MNADMKTSGGVGDVVAFAEGAVPAIDRAGPYPSGAATMRSGYGASSIPSVSGCRNVVVARRPA